MQIIDFHTHPFINELNNVCFYSNIVTASNFKNILNTAGITHSCGSVINHTTDFEEIKKLNAEAIELQNKYEGFYSAGIHIHPDFVEESIDELRKACKQGVKLVGELVPYFNGWSDYYSENLANIYAEIDKLNMVVSIHTDDKVDMNLVEEAVKKFPNINFVAAHPHQKNHYYKHIDLLKKYDNYYLDLSGTGLFRFGMLNTLVNNVGSEKILFGTDFPICNPKMYVEAVLFEKLKIADTENIMYKNALRLLNL